MVNLKYLREKKGVSQKEVADYINKSFQAYSLYETGKRDPDTETLKKLADFFNVSTDYLLGRNESLTQENIIDISPEDLDLLKQIKKASADKQKAIELILNLKEQAAVADK